MQEAKSKRLHHGCASSFDLSEPPDKIIATRDISLSKGFTDKDWKGQGEEEEEESILLLRFHGYHGSSSTWQKLTCIFQKLSVHTNVQS